MKNYYVSTFPTFKMMFRGTRQECEKFASDTLSQWEQCGNRRMAYAVYYDTGTKPESVYKSN